MTLRRRKRPAVQMTEDAVRDLARDAPKRMDFWPRFISTAEIRTMAEVGVYRGAFAARVLNRCPSVRRYYMIDPWRHLDDWDKPANKSDDTFEGFFREVMEKTQRHRRKRVVLRGRTLDVADQIGDEELDFAYVDGDHTLRGITVDLIRIWPKIRYGGWLAGDDFSRQIFQHGDDFEPTLVFPYAVHFAEAVGARIYGLPGRQFLIEKSADHDQEFIDLTGTYPGPNLQVQIARRMRKARRQATGQGADSAGDRRDDRRAEVGAARSRG